MVALLTWIAAHSGYSVPDTLPDVVAMTQADFELYLCEQMESCDSPMPHAEILALFDFESRTVYIRQGFDPADREPQSTMVRQLVHFLQALAGRSRNCRGVLVQEAHQIENRWRTDHGLAAMPITPHGMLLESCGPGPT
jgi:hypothetical protein